MSLQDQVRTDMQGYQQARDRELNRGCGCPLLVLALGLVGVFVMQVLLPYPSAGAHQAIFLKPG